MPKNGSNKDYDLIVIGGGAAGMMAGISAKRKNPDLSIIIIDRTFALGRKILVCGAGRCNITNKNLDESVLDHYYSEDKDFAENIFRQFTYKDIVEFFNDLGIELYVERKTDIGKLFPVTNQAKTVTALLEDELARLNIDILLNTEVKAIETLDAKKLNSNSGNSNTGKFIISTQAVPSANLPVSNNTATTFKSKYLIISAGGKTYPALGSNGSGYRLAESLGHSIVEPVPSALPIEAKSNLSQELQGVKMDIEVTAIIAGVETKTRTDEVLFTKYGLSGPAILNISREISIFLNRLSDKVANNSTSANSKSAVKIKLNFFPGKSKEQVKNELTQRWQKRPTQTVEKSLFGIFPNKIPAVLLKEVGVNKDKLAQNLTSTEVQNILNLLCDYKVKVSATRGWNEAEFTAGGVAVKELNSRTLESNFIKNLYFCGEILDVDGDVGGFNLSWAWSSGFVAGQLN